MKDLSFIRIGREGSEPSVFGRPADGEMVEVLIRPVLEAKDSMHGVVEVTPDPGTPNPSRFSFQIEHLADHSGFPEQSGIEPRTVPGKGLLVLRDHSKTEASIARDVLVTRDLPGGVLGVGFVEAIELQRRRTSDGSLPLRRFGERGDSTSGSPSASHACLRRH